MKKTSYLILVMLLALLLVVQGCTSTDNASQTPAAAETTAAITAAPVAQPAPTAATADELVLTTEELALYNGENGNPAYIAVDGVIYDVTNVREWNGGLHNGYTAGQDLTEQIKTVSPHGVSKLKGLTAVGKLAN